MADATISAANKYGLEVIRMSVKDRDTFLKLAKYKPVNMLWNTDDNGRLYVEFLTWDKSE